MLGTTYAQSRLDSATAEATALRILLKGMVIRTKHLHISIRRGLAAMTQLACLHKGKHARFILLVNVVLLLKFKAGTALGIAQHRCQRCFALVGGGYRLDCRSNSVQAGKQATENAERRYLSVSGILELSRYKLEPGVEGH